MGEPASRRRLLLMRHGSVDYFQPDGTPVPVDDVPLNSRGEDEARAAGELLKACGVLPDRVLISGLPRTRQTAQHVLAAAGLNLPVETDTALQEIRPGRLNDIPRDQLRQAFLQTFQARDDAVEGLRFLNGESVGELLDRVLPAFDRWLARGDWQCGLMVLHGGVNRALPSTAMAGRRAFFGRIEQAPACLNVLDVGSQGNAGPPQVSLTPTGGGLGAARPWGLSYDIVLRAINLTPTQWLHQRERHTTMEKLLAQYARGLA